MDALLLALVSGLFAEVGGRTQSAVAALANAEGQDQRPLLALSIVLIASLGVAATGGLLVSRMMPPNAATLMLGLALACAGLAQWTGKNRSSEPVSWPGMPRALFRLGFAHFTDGTPFLAFAVAAKTHNAGLAMFGAMLAVLVLTLPAIIIRDEWNRPALFAGLRRIAGMVLIIAGAWSAAAGLGVI